MDTPQSDLTEIVCQRAKNINKVLRAASLENHPRAYILSSEMRKVTSHELADFLTSRLVGISSQIRLLNQTSLINTL